MLPAILLRVFRPTREKQRLESKENMLRLQMEAGLPKPHGGEPGCAFTMKSMVATLEKYGGLYFVARENGLFRRQLMLPLGPGKGRNKDNKKGAPERERL